MAGQGRAHVVNLDEYRKHIEAERAAEAAQRKANVQAMHRVAPNLVRRLMVDGDVCPWCGIELVDVDIDGYDAAISEHSTECEPFINENK